MHKDAEPELKPELTVKVTGTVHAAFDLPAVEKDLAVDLDDALSLRTGMEALPAGIND